MWPGFRNVLKKRIAEDKTLSMKKIFLYILVVVLFNPFTFCTKTSDKTSPTTAGKGGSLARFTIAGNYLYTVDKSTLKSYDISSASSPVLKDSIEVGFEIETIFPFKDKLFIGSTSVVHIFSIEDPEHPVKLSTAISPDVLRRCDPVVAKDSVAYATLRTNGACGGTQSILAVYNIKDITNPVQVNWDFIAEPYGLGYADNALYVCDKSSLIVYDISDAYNPVRATIVPDNEFIDVIPYGNTLVCWIKKGIALYDITNRLQPQFVTTIN